MRRLLRFACVERWPLSQPPPLRPLRQRGPMWWESQGSSHPRNRQRGVPGRTGGVTCLAQRTSCPARRLRRGSARFCRRPPRERPFQRLPARLAHQLSLQGRSAAVLERRRRSLLAGEMAITPLAEHDDHRVEILAGLGQEVLEPCRVLRVLPALQDLGVRPASGAERRACRGGRRCGGPSRRSAGCRGAPHGWRAVPTSPRRCRGSAPPSTPGAGNRKESPAHCTSGSKFWTDSWSGLYSTSRFRMH